jgi:hypothetical protein
MCHHEITESYWAARHAEETEGDGDEEDGVAEADADAPTRTA